MGKCIMSEELLHKGRHALNVGAWEEAKELLEDAVRVDESAEALEELAWANWWLNDIPAVFELRTRAHNQFLDRGDKRGASRTASWLGLDYLEFNGEFAVANGWFQRAENLLENEGVCRELIIIGILKSNLAFRVERNTQQALKLIDKTLEMAQNLEYVEGQMLGEGLKGFILVTEGKVVEGMKLLDEATLLALSEKSGDIRTITTTCCFLIDACQRIRDYERADQWCIKVKEICRRWRHRAVFATCRTQYAAVLISRGDWKEAEDELLAAAHELNEFKPAALGICMIRLADLKRRQGKWKEAAELLDKIKSHSLKAIGCASLAYDQGDFEAALHMGEKFLRQIPLHERTERIAGIELLLQANLQLGNHGGAKALLTELEEITKEIPTPPLKAAALNAKGLCLAFVGDHETARHHLEDAIDLYDQLSLPYEAARARLEIADVLEKVGRHSQAENQLKAALESFENLDASKDAERTRFMMKTIGSSSKHHPHNFTGRELAVLRLIAAGKNNEEIAAQLFLSVRTIEKHLSNIYQKMGVSGKSARAFAASFAVKKLALN